MIEHLLKGFRFEKDHSSYFFVYDLYTAVSTGNPKFHVGANVENFHGKNGCIMLKTSTRQLWRGQICLLHRAQASPRWEHTPCAKDFLCTKN